MKNMRQLINLMEGVVAIPGLNEKSTSEKQARFMAAASHNPEFAKKTGISSNVAKEFNKADSGTKQLSNAMKHKTNEEYIPNAIEEESFSDYSDVDSEIMHIIQSSSDSFGNKEDALNDVSRYLISQGFEQAEIHRIMGNLESYLSNEMPAAELAVAKDAMDSFGYDPDEDIHRSDDPYDLDDPAPMEETPEISFDEEIDLNNGYDDTDVASGNDYFPNGADSPVTASVGPSGARQGDNPEQKKMQVAEVHKELVYGYRNFLKEENITELKKSTLKSYAKKSSVDADKHMWAGDKKAQSGDINGAMKDFDKTASRNKNEIKALTKAGVIKDTSKK